MGQRNMSNSQMINLELDHQPQFHLHPEPCIISNYPHHNVDSILPVAEHPMAGFVPHHLSGYNGVHYQLAANAGVSPATTSNYYNPYMNPPAPNVFPLSIEQGSQFMNGIRGVFKRKSTEGYPENFQNCNSEAGPSSALPLTMEVGGPEQCVRLGPVGGETGLAHNPNHHMVQGNYQGQALVPANAPWLEQRFGANGGNRGTWTWSQAPAIPFVHASGVNGGFTAAELYHQEIAVHRSSPNFQHPPPAMYQGHHLNLYHPQQRMHGGSFYPQVTDPSNRLAGNSSVNPLLDGMQVALGYVLPIRPTGVSLYHDPCGVRAIVPEATTMRHHHGHSNLSLLRAEEVAMLEGYYEMGHGVDHLRDMRLDVDNMSYEELLALEDHIGYVPTGLSEKTILNHLKIRTHVSSSASMDMEDQETDFCTICQTNYENQDKVGTLDCGHEYHTGCIKRWLIIKNICPICKSSALKMKGSMREG